MAHFGTREMSANEKFKYFAIALAEQGAEMIQKDRSKVGILLCEGTENSMDVFLYTKVYPEFIVVPAGGCTDIRRLLPFMKKYFEYPTFGLIDRDNCSKNYIRMLVKKERVYCTRLPFIENILCCPEVIKIIAPETKREYSEILKRVQSEFARLLVDKMSLLNPFNIDLPLDKPIQMVSFVIVTQGKVVHKRIDLSNVMYTFRDKAIVSKVSDAMGFNGREDYYQFLKEQMNGKNGEKIVATLSKYLPVIMVEEME